MQVFNIASNPTLANRYRGSGYAIGSVVGGQLVDFQYLRDVLPAFEGDFTDDGNGHYLAIEAINDPRIGPVVRQMQAIGDVVVGMCSAYEFVVL